MISPFFSAVCIYDHARHFPTNNSSSHLFNCICWRQYKFKLNTTQSETRRNTNISKQSASLTRLPSLEERLWKIRWGKASDIVPTFGMSWRMTTFIKVKYAVGPYGRWQMVIPSVQNRIRKLPYKNIRYDCHLLRMLYVIIWNLHHGQSKLQLYFTTIWIICSSFALKQRL